ncbi:MAG: HEAT repeat domain-containing protein [Planctomycetota bacterium]|jgi:hypothetical protein
MGEKLGIYSEVEFEAARDLVRGLIRFIRSWRLYEGEHPTLGELQVKLREKWERATAGGPVSLKLTDRRVLLDEEPLYQSRTNEVLPGGLYEHGVVGLIFQRGLEPSETRRFVEALAVEPDASVDYATLLWEADLKHIQVLQDVDESEEEVSTPAEVAEQIATLGDPEDPQVGDDYDEEREELGRVSCNGSAAEPEDFDRFALSPVEKRQIEVLRASDRYDTTVRQAARMIHSMAGEVLSPEDAETLEKGIVALTAAVALTGDLDAAIEIAARARRMGQSAQDLEMRVGELTVETLQDRQHLWTLFRALDRREYLDRRALGELLAQLGEPAAAPVGEWLLETRHPGAVADAMRVLGEAGTEVLVGLYVGHGDLGRERVGPALLRIGTPRALLALAAELDTLPQETRLRLMHLIGRNEDPGLRRAVLTALDDPVQAVRSAAAGAVRKTDAPALAALLEEYFERGVFESRYRKETDDFFEMLARVGDGNVARVLAERCLAKRFGLAFGRMTPLQQLCVRALRRMRSPDAKPVVEELKRKGPKAVREILDNPLGELD